jgi:hypothetical protein
VEKNSLYIAFCNSKWKIRKEHFANMTPRLCKPATHSVGLFLGLVFVSHSKMVLSSLSFPVQAGK